MILVLGGVLGGGAVTACPSLSEGLYSSSLTMLWSLLPSPEERKDWVGAWVVSVSSSLGVPAVRRSTMAETLNHSSPVPSNELNSVAGGGGVGVANEEEAGDDDDGDDAA